MILTEQQFQEVFKRLNERWEFFKSLNQDHLMSAVVKDIYDDGVRCWMLLGNEAKNAEEFKVAMRKLAFDNSTLNHRANFFQKQLEEAKNGKEENPGNGSDDAA